MKEQAIGVMYSCNKCGYKTSYPITLFDKSNGFITLEDRYCLNDLNKMSVKLLKTPHEE